MVTKIISSGDQPYQLVKNTSVSATTSVPIIRAMMCPDVGDRDGA
jgi:hypothetical protein